MTRQVQADDMAAIENVVAGYQGGASAQQIWHDLGANLPLRTLQYRLRRLVTAGHLVRTSAGKSPKYHLLNKQSVTVVGASHTASVEPDAVIPLSTAAAEAQIYVRQAFEARKPVGYNRAFLDNYRPNVTSYLTEEERGYLAQIGRSRDAAQPAGTYAKHILNRLLIDLAWNSSRLEGNTYSLLDTKRLIEFGEEAATHAHLEAQMILNHKDAIEFLVGNADEVGFNRYTILNLHAMLANNLLADPTAVGRLRHIAVGIERSAFYPLEIPLLIEECLDQILATAAAINDPFEQMFFIMVQLPYLQPFDDVNKRVSRLAANIPLIRANLLPLSFTDVPQQIYTEAMLSVYELNKVDLLKHVFIWAYERSTARYAAVRQSLGDPDPFRLQYREALREIVGNIVRDQLGKREAVARIAAWTKERVDQSDQGRFIEVAEAELAGLHEGNFARYQIRPAIFMAWQNIWKTPV